MGTGEAGRKDIELLLESVGAQRRPPMAPVDRYEFLVAMRGRASFAAAGRARVFGPPDAAFVIPGEPRALRALAGPGCSGGDARVARVSFSPSWASAAERAWLVASLAARPPAERTALVLGSEAFASFARKIEGHGAMDGPVAEPLMVPLAESLFLDLAIELLRDDEERRGENAPHWLRTACASMERRKNLRAGGERLVELAGKSREHVIRQMRRYYGMTPTQFVNELRLRTASRLLVESDQPVLDIGYSLGFQNPSYFAQLFKEKFGMPPTRFRAVRRR